MSDRSEPFPYFQIAACIAQSAFQADIENHDAMMVLILAAVIGAEASGVSETALRETLDQIEATARDEVRASTAPRH